MTVDPPPFRVGPGLGGTLRLYVESLVPTSPTSSAPPFLSFLVGTPWVPGSVGVSKDVHPFEAVYVL